MHRCIEKEKRMTLRKIDKITNSTLMTDEKKKKVFVD